MQVRELMTSDLVTCSEDTAIPRVAGMMAEHDCGVVPVVDDDRRPAGMITDRDIAIRVVARDEVPNTVQAADVMTENPVDVSPDADVDEAARRMEEHRVRRLAVTDDDGRLVGVIAQADLARHADPDVAGEVVAAVSERTATASETARA